MSGTTRILEMTAGATRTLELMGSPAQSTHGAAWQAGPGTGAIASRAQRDMGRAARGAPEWAAELAHHAGGLLAIAAAVVLWAWVVAGVLVPVSATLARLEAGPDGAAAAAAPARTAAICPLPAGALASAAAPADAEACR